MKDFFISYNRADRTWAEWIAWQLEAENYTTILQAWDFRPGANFVLEMQRSASEAVRTIAVLSPDYLTSRFTQPEWAAAFAQDPTGEKRLLLPVRVRAYDPQGLLPQIVYIDLVGRDETSARRELLQGVQSGRVKPTSAPAFPGAISTSPTERPPFPGTIQSGGIQPENISSTRTTPALSLRRWVLIALIIGLLSAALMLALRCDSDANRPTATAETAVAAATMRQDTTAATGISSTSIVTSAMVPGISTPPTVAATPTSGSMGGATRTPGLASTLPTLPPAQSGDYVANFEDWPVRNVPQVYRTSVDRTGGEYHILITEGDYQAFVNANVNHADFVLQVDVRRVAGPDTAALGLIFRLQRDNRNEERYIFYITPDGHFALVSLNKVGIPREIVGPQESDAIEQGNSDNRLTVTCRGEKSS